MSKIPWKQTGSNSSNAKLPRAPHPAIGLLKNQGDLFVTQQLPLTGRHALRQ